MLTPFDDTPWHQLPSPFDAVGTSDPRFFDRLWFAATDPSGGGTMQFTLGVYQNMNVVDGGFVAIVDQRQHNVRVSRQLRPTYESACGPLRIEVLEPMERLRLSAAPGEHALSAELEWVAALPPEVEPQHFKRVNGRVVEDYCRYDQIGTCNGWIDAAGTRVEVRDWWACRDHSWGVRERVGIPEPVTGPPTAAAAPSLFAFLFYSTDRYGGHVQVAGDAITVTITDRATGEVIEGDAVNVRATFVDDGRPRRIREGTFDVRAGDRHIRFDVTALGSAVAMPGLGYGGYDDGLGLGVWRGIQHLERDTWDVSHPADVVYEDGSGGRPVHRIQPVTVVQDGPDGTSTGVGSLTFIDERPLGSA
jgi:hypothetical protein